LFDSAAGLSKFKLVVVGTVVAVAILEIYERIGLPGTKGQSLDRPDILTNENFCKIAVYDFMI
jgi:hypothetical protein